jgi:hypothetical protein
VRRIIFKQASDEYLITQIDQVSLLTELLLEFQDFLNQMGTVAEWLDHDDSSKLLTLHEMLLFKLVLYFPTLTFAAFAERLVEKQGGIHVPTNKPQSYSVLQTGKKFF